MKLKLIDWNNNILSIEIKDKDFGSLQEGDTLLFSYAGCPTAAIGYIIKEII